MTPRLFPAAAGNDDASAFDFDAQLDNDTWLTPRWILAQLGSFDLDPCAADCNPTWTGATVCVHRGNGAHLCVNPAHADGLALKWAGRVFLNPPFSCIDPWVERMAEHNNGIALLPAGHETDAWRRFVWGRASAVFLLRGRVRFTAPDGSTTGGRPRCPVALVSYDPGIRRVDPMRNFGTLMSFNGQGVFLSEWTNYPREPK